MLAAILLLQFIPSPGVAHLTKQPPLKCPQYQHVYHWPGQCGPAPCDDGPLGYTCYSVCAPVPPDKCEDDIHEVTEREWQEIMKRLEQLELKTDGKLHAN